MTMIIQEGPDGGGTSPLTLPVAPSPMSAPPAPAPIAGPLNPGETPPIYNPPPTVDIPIDTVEWPTNPKTRPIPTGETPPIIVPFPVVEIPAEPGPLTSGEIPSAPPLSAPLQPSPLAPVGQYPAPNATPERLSSEGVAYPNAQTPLETLQQLLYFYRNDFGQVGDNINYPQQATPEALDWRNRIRDYVRGNGLDSIAPLWATGGNENNIMFTPTPEWPGLGPIITGSNPNGPNVPPGSAGPGVIVEPPDGYGGGRNPDVPPTDPTPVVETTNAPTVDNVPRPVLSNPTGAGDPPGPLSTPSAPGPMSNPTTTGDYQDAYSFVYGLYQKYLIGPGSPINRTAPDGAINTWVNYLTQGALTRAQVEQGFIDSPEFRQRAENVSNDLQTRITAYLTGFTNETPQATSARLSLRDYYSSLGAVSNFLTGLLPSWLTGADSPLPLPGGSGGGGGGAVAPSGSPSDGTPTPTTPSPIPTVGDILRDIFSGGTSSSTGGTGSTGASGGGGGGSSKQPTIIMPQQQAAPDRLTLLNSKLGIALAIVSIIAAIFGIWQYSKKGN
jgi:hypothetical protein